MQDRLQQAARQLIAESESWGRASPTSPATSASGSPASEAPVGEAAKALVKSLGTLRNVLSPVLQPEEVQYIFGRVTSLYSEALAAALDSLATKGPAWEQHRKANALFLLQVGLTTYCVWVDCGEKRSAGGRTLRLGMRPF